MVRKLFAFGFVLLLAGAGIGTWAWWYFGAEQSVVLAKEKQEAIWRAEHVTFEIENYFGKPFAAALRSGKLDEAGHLFAEEFEAAVFERQAPTTRRHSTLEEQLWKAADHSAKNTDQEGLLDFFRSALADFESVQGSRVRVLQIKPVAGESTHFETELLVTVRGSMASGARGELASHHHATFNVASDDVIRKGGALLSWSIDDAKLTISNSELMQEVTKDTGLDQIGVPDNWDLPVSDTQMYQFQCAVADFDRDGFLDIALAGYRGQPMLLRNVEGKKFEPIPVHEIGIRPWQSMDAARNGLCAWIDYDNDGYPDLIMGPHVYRNVGGLRFKDVTQSSGLKFDYDPMGCTVIDYDCDGLLDLYVNYQAESGEPPEKLAWVGDEVGGKANQLWRNTGNGRFVNVTEKANAGGGARSTFASSWFFYDDDHYPDVYMANDFGINVILRNKGDGTFEDVSIASGASDFATSMGVATGDINNDGVTEVYVANMYSKMGRRIISQVSNSDYPAGIYDQIKGSCAGNRLYTRADSKSPFADISLAAQVNEVGWAYAPLMADFDEDGLLDLYSTSGFMSFSRKKPDG